MSDVTQLLSAIDAGDPRAADQLLPLVYEELRKLAAGKIAKEKPGQTLQATALVHEAWLRLAGSEQQGEWKNRGHFFGAAAEAMRRILVDRARRKARVRHGGQLERVDLEHVSLATEDSSDVVLAIHEALAQLAHEAPQKAEIVKLRYFTGLEHAEIAQVLGLSEIRDRGQPIVLPTSERSFVCLRQRCSFAAVPLRVSTCNPPVVLPTTVTVIAEDVHPAVRTTHHAWMSEAVTR